MSAETRGIGSIEAPLPVGTPVRVSSEHFAEECAGVIIGADYDDGWFYHIDVQRGDRLNDHRDAARELWVCDFEVEPIEAKEA